MVLGNNFDTSKNIWYTCGDICIATYCGLKNQLGTYAYVFVIGDKVDVLDGYNAEISKRNKLTLIREELLVILSTHYILKVLSSVQYLDPMRILNKEMDVEYEIIRKEALIYMINTTYK